MKGRPNLTENSPLLPVGDVVIDINNSNIELVRVEPMQTNLNHLPVDVFSVIASHLSIRDANQLSKVNKELLHKVNNARRRIKLNADDAGINLTYKDIFSRLNQNKVELNRASTVNYSLRYRILKNILLGYSITTGFVGGFAFLAVMGTHNFGAIMGATVGIPGSGTLALGLSMFAARKEAQWKYNIEIMKNIDTQPDLIVEREKQLAVEVEIAKEDQIEPPTDGYGYY